MTLVIAVACRDGIVLASDGQATCDAAGQPTRQPARKLFDIGGRIAWGSAGSAGLQQTVGAELAQLNGRTDDPAQMRRRLASAVIPHQQRAVRDFVPHDGADPPELACLFCWWDPQRGPVLLTVPRTGSDHQFHEDFAAIGSGDIFAAFSMRSVAHFGTRHLGLQQAKMVAYKAVADAIEVAAVYLGPPIQIYEVTDAGARRVAGEEVDGALADAVSLWKVRQRETLGELGPTFTPAPGTVTV